MGSWKIMEMSSPRSFCRARLSISKISSPSKRMEPSRIFPVFSASRRRMLRAVVDLPAPVSPTRPRVSPSFTVKLTPLTAYTVSRSVS